ncbi:hypothetical protein [Sphingomonas sp. 3-13AW]|uniref:hypothetical protein n=1 Tax=Sphingomonas sp. 3-13AW TaxID=3050450 RepID=UPI003BB64F3A
MTDPRSAATVEADLDMISMILSDVDLTRPDDAVSAFPLASTVTVEFVCIGETILRVEDAPTLGSAIRRLGSAVASNPDRQYLESSRVLPSDRPDVLRIAVLLTPVDISVDGLRRGMFGTRRMQAFASAHEGVDAETLPAEQAEAVNLVRDALGIE